VALSGLITVTEEGPRPLRLKMVRMIFAAVVALAAVVFGLQPAKAYEPPYRQRHTHPQ
jgi:hypothetical protein